MLENLNLKLQYDTVRCRERVQFGSYRFVRPSRNVVIPDFTVFFFFSRNFVFSNSKSLFCPILQLMK